MNERLLAGPIWVFKWGGYALNHRKTFFVEFIPSNLLRWKWMDMNHFSNMSYRKAFRSWRPKQPPAFPSISRFPHIILVKHSFWRNLFDYFVFNKIIRISGSSICPQRSHRYFHWICKRFDFWLLIFLVFQSRIILRSIFWMCIPGELSMY